MPFPGREDSSHNFQLHTVPLMQSCVTLSMPKINVSEGINRPEKKVRTPGRQGCLVLPAAMGLFKKRLLFGRGKKKPTPVVLPRSGDAQQSSGHSQQRCLRADFTYTPNYSKISKYFRGEKKRNAPFLSQLIFCHFQTLMAAVPATNDSWSICSVYSVPTSEQPFSLL